MKEIKWIRDEMKSDELLFNMDSEKEIYIAGVCGVKQA